MTNQIRRADLGLGKTARGGSGGSYASFNRGASAPPPQYAGLANATAQREAIVATLIERGYVHASTVESATNPSFTDGIDVWWQQHYERMEQQPAGRGAYKIMPDDYTPGMTSGHALSGHRRTHRMNYRGAGVNLRMPSATAIRRFSKENNRQTFDLPIEMEHEGGRIAGFVRITEGAGGSWDVRALGFPDSKSRNRAAESVACVLESRRPSLALREAEAHYEKVRRLNIEARRRGEEPPVRGDAKSPLQQVQIDRAARAGAELHAPAVPSFIKAVGYDRGTQTMTIRMKGNRSYAYHVPRQVYEEIARSGSPGRAYNELVKGKADRVEVTRCPKCRRINRATVQHACPATLRAPQGRFNAFRSKVQTLMLNLGVKRAVA